MIKIIYWLALFYLGAIIGSFLNVVIYRVPRNLSLWKPRSHCPHCRQTLRWKDNLPIISYLLLRGHCRYCHQRISPRYLKVELLSGLVWVAVIATYGWSVSSLGWIILLEGLLGLAWIDLRWGIVPDGIVLAIILIGVCLFIFIEPYLFIPRFWGMAAASGFMVLVAFLGKLLFKKEAVGGGDIKLAAAIGLFLGVKLSLLSLLFAFAIGGAYGSYQLSRKKLAPGSSLPLVPFLFAAVFLVVLFGNSLWGHYLNLIGVQ